MAKAKIIYPDTPKTKAGYTDAWIASYLNDKASAAQISKFLKAIKDKEKKEQRNIFYDMFIAEKPKKTKPSFEDELKAIAKQKREEAKKAKEV